MEEIKDINDIEFNEIFLDHFCPSQYTLKLIGSCENKFIIVKTFYPKKRNGSFFYIDPINMKKYEIEDKFEHLKLFSGKLYNRFIINSFQDKIFIYDVLKNICLNTDLDIEKQKRYSKICNFQITELIYLKEGIIYIGNDILINLNKYNYEKNKDIEVFTKSQWFYLNNNFYMVYHSNNGRGEFMFRITNIKGEIIFFSKDFSVNVFKDKHIIYNNTLYVCRTKQEDNHQHSYICIFDKNLKKFEEIFFKYSIRKIFLFKEIFFLTYTRNDEGHKYLGICFFSPIAKKFINANIYYDNVHIDFDIYDNTFSYIDIENKSKYIMKIYKINDITYNKILYGSLENNYPILTLIRYTAEEYQEKDPETAKYIPPISSSNKNSSLEKLLIDFSGSPKYIPPETSLTKSYPEQSSIPSEGLLIDLPISYFTNKSEEESIFNTNPLPKINTIHLCSVEECIAYAQIYCEELSFYDFRLNIQAARIHAEDNTNLEITDIEDKIAIRLYTQETPLYKLLNRALRNRNRKEIIPFLPFFKRLLHALYQLPLLKNSTINRGISKDVSEQYIKNIGKKIIEWSFCSCTGSINVLKDFIGQKTTLLQINTSNVVDIKKYSSMEHEDERIILPGSVFIVKGFLDLKNGTKIIQLEQDPKNLCMLDYVHTLLKL